MKQEERGGGKFAPIGTAYMYIYLYQSGRLHNIYMYMYIVEGLNCIWLYAFKINPMTTQTCMFAIFKEFSWEWFLQ